MAVRTRRTTGFALGSSRAVCRLGLGAIFLAVSGYGLQFANAIGDTRTITLHHIHTNEDISITFKRNGRFDDAALKKLNWFLRDWRRDEQITMDPNLFDMLWEVHREVGAKGPIQVIGGYRAPETNSMLRARSTGVALHSQHMSGNAIDFSIPGVEIEAVRVAALRLQGGGVGYYPASGSRFVHLDTGNVRHWPRMTRDELAKVFPTGRTIHIPSDGQPLSGYSLALAEIERNGRLAPQPRQTVLAKLHGAHEDEEISTGSTRPPPMPASRPANLVTAALNNAPPPLPTPKPQQVVTQISAETPKMPAEPPRRPQVAAASINPASIFLPWPTTQQDRVSPEIALAYAAVARQEPAPRTALTNVQRPAIQPEPKRLAPPTLDRATITAPATAAIRADNPWLHAVVLSPSMYTYMTATQFNPLDTRQLGTMMAKPTSVIAMSFSADPYNGMTTTAFSGKAIQFLATVSFNTRTAALSR